MGGDVAGANLHGVSPANHGYDTPGDTMRPPVDIDRATPAHASSGQIPPPWLAKMDDAPHRVFIRSPFGGSRTSRVSVSPYFSPMSGTPIYLPLYLSVSYVGRSFHPLPSAVLCLHQEEMLLE